MRLILIALLLTACAKNETPAPVEAFHQKVDGVRDYINRNSRHGSSSINLDTDMDVVLDQLKANEANGTPDTLMVQCGIRSELMMRLLRDINITSRLVGVWTDNGSAGNWGHAFIEVLNPNTGQWEAQDPTFNVYYLKPDGQRASASELVAMDESEIVPCSNGQCGWAYVSQGTPDYPISYMLDFHMFDAVVIHELKQVLVNPSRYDVNFYYQDLGSSLIEHYAPMGYSGVNVF